MNDGYLRISLRCARFVAVLALSFALYALTLPYYRSMVLGMTNAILSCNTPAIRVESSADDTWLVRVAPSGGSTEWAFNMGHPYYSPVVFLNMAILPPLMFLTPANLGTRLRLLGIALVVCTILNIFLAILVISTIGTSCYGRLGDVMCLNLTGLLSPGGQVSAVAVWGVVTWRYWRRGATSHGVR